MVKKLIAALPALSLILAGWTCGPLSRSAAPAPTVTQAPAVASGPSVTQAPTAAKAPSATTRPPATQAPTATIASTATLAPTAAVSMPSLSLKRGDSYFNIGGRQQFIYGRNLTGSDQTQFDTFLGWTKAGGSQLVRVQITGGWWGTPWITSAGQVNEAWAKDWDGFLDQAQADGLYVIPVFGVWADWNDGTPNYGYANWKYNPLNTANGGPIATPGELFVKGSPAQTLWLSWVKSLVERWQARPNIAAWEIFSEINLAAGAPALTDAEGGVDETVGADFADRAAAMVRAADPQRRPITTSLAGTYQPKDAWANFYNDDTLDFIEIHPYTERLDVELVSEVAQMLGRYHRPVLIGESGLSAYLTPGMFPGTATRGIRHAIWAAIVSGAMNGRSLWTEDGYAIYWDANNLAPSLAFIETYKDAERAAASFVQGVDFAGYQPLEVSLADGVGVWGAAMGNENSAIGWFRDASSEPPNWDVKPLISKQSVTLHLPGAASTWTVDFYSPETGVPLGHSATVTLQGPTLTVALPDFTDDIAFKLARQQEGNRRLKTAATKGTKPALRRVQTDQTRMATGARPARPAPSLRASRAPRSPLPSQRLPARRRARASSRGRWRARAAG